MNEVVLSNTVMPILCGCDFIVASEPFYHATRTADYHVLIYVAEGEIYVTEDDVDYTISAGELLFLKSGVSCCGKRLIQRGTKWYYIHFLCEQQEQQPLAPDSSPIPQYTEVGCSVVLPKQLYGLSGGDTEHDLAEFIRRFHSDEPLKRWQLNPMLFQLLSRIGVSGISPQQISSLPDRICSYLSRSLHVPFSADAVSREFYLSYKHLASVFKHAKGMSMQQYHTRLRMNEACRLLRSTLLPVGEIAAQLGYQDMLYFSRCFKSCHGISPTEYRKLPPMQ